MREHGTLFSAPMVRAVLADVEPKTQTRRILTRANSVLDYDGGPLAKWPGLDFVGRIHPHYPWAFPSDAKPSCEGAPEGVVSLCVYASDLPTYKPGERTCHRIYPRVRPGDRLWGRETWAIHIDGEHDASQALADARAQMPWASVIYRANVWERAEKWRPSLLMPRWASRITLEVTDVRVERVQDISDADIRAEGVTAEAVRALLGRDTVELGIVSANGRRDPRSVVATPLADLSPRELWRIGWTAINGAESWDANVWLWCYSFRRVS